MLTEVHRENCIFRREGCHFLGTFRSLKQACQFARIRDPGIIACPHCVKEEIILSR